MKDKGKYKSIIEKIRKLKTLSEKGVPNERDVAARKLSQLMKKYGVSFSELDNPERTSHNISYARCGEFFQVLCQIVWSVNPDTEIFRNSNARHITAELSYSEYIEVMNKFSFYLKLYRKQKNIFDIAFVHSYDLLRKKRNDNEDSVEDPYTPDELDLIHKMVSTMPESGYVATTKRLEGVIKTASQLSRG